MPFSIEDLQGVLARLLLGYDLAHRTGIHGLSGGLPLIAAIAHALQ
ncbi:MAG: hypothetical protein ACR2HR_18315 [Euzebya sp.]